MWLEFELTYFLAAVKYFSNYTSGTSLICNFNFFLSTITFLFLFITVLKFVCELENRCAVLFLKISSHSDIAIALGSITTKCLIKPDTCTYLKLYVFASEHDSNTMNTNFNLQSLKKNKIQFRTMGEIQILNNEIFMILLFAFIQIKYGFGRNSWNF